MSVLSSRAGPPPASGRAQLTFQARLTTPQGQPITGVHAFTFHICDAPTGDGRLWSESQDALVTNGLLSVVLGRDTPLSPAVLDPAGGSDRYVAIELAGDEVARVKLTATAYSIVAGVANAVWDPASSTGLDLSALDARYVQTGGSGGGVLRTVNGVGPSASGDFSISPGPSGRVSVTPTANGVEVDAQGGDLDLATADGRYVNVTGDTVAGDLGVSGALTTGSILTVQLRAHMFEFTGGVQGPFLSPDGAFSFRRPSHPPGTSEVTFATGHPRDTVSSHHSLVGNTALMGRVLIEQELTTHGLHEARGGLVVPTGAMKAFYHDLGDGTGIYYCCLEGPESTNFIRGVGQLSNGVAAIDLPEHFRIVTEGEGVTAHLTPLGPTPGLYVVRSDHRQLEVRESPGGAGDVRFNYLVLGVRVGHKGEQPIRPAPGR
ncbi:MAG: hypothetical protein M9894_22450 [Planctomycetes bacterium]|nr:hypothetical protein [Planctomycetota bacterium]